MINVVNKFVQAWTSSTGSYCLRVLISLSMLLNVVTGGRVHQPFSARNWQWKKENKFNLVYIIDMCYGESHCMHSWIRWTTRQEIINELSRHT